MDLWEGLIIFTIMMAVNLVCTAIPSLLSLGDPPSYRISECLDLQSRGYLNNPGGRMLIFSQPDLFDYDKKHVGD